MKCKQDINCDLIIIGAGFAGMVAAARASSLGLKTVQVGSSSSLFFVSGLLDLLGVYPLDSNETLVFPKKGLDKLTTDIPFHPYSKIHYKKIIASLDFLKGFLQSGGLDYHLSRDDNLFVLTAAGTIKPSFMVPTTMLKGCALVKKQKKLLIVDFKGLKGFSAKQIAEVLYKTNPGTRTLTVEIPDLAGDLNPTQLANLFEDVSFLKYLAKKIKKISENIDLVGLPAVCGLYNSLEKIQILEKMTQLDCFEIPGLPPSVPGMRLKNVFEKKLSKENVIFLCNAKINSYSFEKNQFTLTAVTQNMDTQIKAKGVILASGRFPGGGLNANRDQIRETVFDLPVHQPEKRNQWYHLNFFHSNGHAINKSGLETDKVFRPVDQSKQPKYQFLYAVGSILAHNDWIRLKSGSGVSCATACIAVDHFNNKLFEGAHD